MHLLSICRSTSTILRLLPGVSKKYPLLTGNRNEKIRYNYSPNGQLNLSIFNLDSRTVHSKIVYQTPEMQACKVKIYSAPKTRGFVKGPRLDLTSQPCCKRIRTLTFSFFAKNDTLKCFNCSTDNYSFEESICALHSILSVNEEEKSTCKFIFEMSHDFIILEPDSHWVVCVVRVVQKDPTDKTQGLSPLYFGSFCTTLTTLTT